MNKEELIEKYKDKLLKAEKRYEHDEETLHIIFDDILIEILNELGFEDISRIYNNQKENFYYA